MGQIEQKNIKYLVLAALLVLSSCSKIGTFKSEGEVSALTNSSFPGISGLQVDVNNQFIVNWEKPNASGEVKAYKIYAQSLTPGSDYSVDASAENIANRKYSLVTHDSVNVDDYDQKILLASLPTSIETSTIEYVLSVEKEWFITVSASNNKDEEIVGASSVLLYANTAYSYPGCSAASAIAHDKVLVTFDYPADAEKLVITRDGVPIYSTADVGSSSYQDSGLAEGKSYAYNCVIYYGSEEINSQNISSVTTQSMSDAFSSFVGCTSGNVVDNTRIQVSYEFPPEFDRLAIKRNGTTAYETVSRTGTTFLDSGLIEGETYIYSCVGVISGTEVLGTNQIELQTLSSNAPLFAGIDTVQVSGSNVTLNWKNPTTGVAIDKIEVYVTAVDPSAGSPAIDWGSSLKDISGIGSVSTTLTLNDIGDDQKYIVGLRSCSKALNCDTNTVTKTFTLGDFGVPRTTGAASVQIVDGRAEITAPWTILDGGITERQVFFKCTGNGGCPGAFTSTQDFTIIEPWNPKTTLLLSQGLFSNTTYEFYVLDEDSSGNITTNSSQVVSVYVTDIIKPVFPGLTDLQLGSPTDTSLDVQFVAITSQPGDGDGATSYVVYTAIVPSGQTRDACNEDGTQHSLISAAGETATATVTHAITGLLERTKYNVCVKAVDAAGNYSVTTQNSSVTTQDNTAPIFYGAETVAYSTANSRVDVTWTASVSADINEYEVTVFRGTKASPVNLTTFRVDAATNQNGTSFDKNTFAYVDGEIIYVLVDACDDASPTFGTENCSDTGDTTPVNNSAIALAVPDISPPLGFPGISAVTQTSEGTATITWSAPAPNYTDYRGFKVYDYRTSSLVLVKDCPCSAVNCPLSETTCLVDVDPYRNYDFHVRAYDVGGNETDYAPLDPPSGSKISHLSMDETAPIFSSGVNLQIEASPPYEITWNAPIDLQYDSGASISYWVYRKKDGAFSDINDPGAEIASIDVVKKVTATAAYTESDSLSEGSTYYYTVCGLDASNNIKCSGETTVRVVDDLTDPTINTQLASDKTASSNSWNVTFSISDNFTAVGTLGVKIYRTESDAAETPAISLGNQIGSGTGTTFGCNPCTISAETGPANVIKYINYIVVVTDQAGFTATSDPLSLLWSNEPVTVSHITRSGGAFTGGKLVDITGTNFVEGATVKLGTLTCTLPVVESSKKISCVTPDATATYTSGDSVPVIVTNGDGRFNPSQGIIYTFGGTGHECDGVLDANFPSGAGTSGDPYIICDATHLAKISEDSTAYYLTRDNIDLTGITWTSIPGAFKGSLSGENLDADTVHPDHIIRSLTGSNGLFSQLGSGNPYELHNLYFTGANIGGGGYVGVVASSAPGSHGAPSVAGVSKIYITNSVVTGTGYIGGAVGSVSGFGGTWDDIVVRDTTVQKASSGNSYYFGGIIGHSDNGGGGVLSNSYFSGVVDGAGSSGALSGTGGILGIQDGYIYLNTATVDAEIKSTGDNVGGIIGYQKYTAYWWWAPPFKVTGSVTSTDQGDYVGGIIGRVGHDQLTISGSYFKGAVSGGSYVGGLFGNDVRWKIIDSYTTGTVTGTGPYVGGLVGEHDCVIDSPAYSAENVWSSAVVSGSTTVGGLFGDMDQCYLEKGAFYGTVKNLEYGSKDSIAGATTAPANITDCLWDNTVMNPDWDNTDGTGTSAALTTSNATSCVGASTADLKLEATYTGQNFDFTTIWTIPSVGEYPIIISNP